MSDNSSFYVPLGFVAGCFRSHVSVAVFSAICAADLLVLPVFLLVLHLGYQQRRRRRSGAAAAAAGHSDVFTYHGIATQLSEFLGLFVLFFGGYYGNLTLVCLGVSLSAFTSTAQALFHILTCVEHYLAVVQPVAYLRLKRAGELRVRNLCAGCVWLLSCVWLLVFVFTGGADLSFVLYLSVVGFSLVVISSCCVSVLCALRRPGPGNKDRADPSKRRAFNTILTIMVVLVFEFAGNMTLTVVKYWMSLGPTDTCVTLMSSVWVDLPGSLVLPLLFLHRAGKPQCCRRSAEPR